MKHSVFAATTGIDPKTFDRNRIEAFERSEPDHLKEHVDALPQGEERTR